MNFIAFLLALVVERLSGGRLDRLRDVALGGYARAALAAIAAAGPLAVPMAVLVLLLPGALALAASAALARQLPGPAPILLTTLVLLVALGPRDLRREVGAYRAALAAGDADGAARAANQLLGDDAAQRVGQPLETVAEAVFVQANNRVFGVLFWFVVLGPVGLVGALGFRVSDLVRRAAIRGAAGAPAATPVAARAHFCQRLHGVLAFLPARLAASSYGVAGSFEESFSGWRAYLAAETGHFFDANDRLLVHAGVGALGSRWAQGDPGERAAAALGLAEAAFLVWLAAFALLTVGAWAA